MGVRYLTRFLQRNSLIRDERLSGCPLVIDGSNLSWVLYERLRNTTVGVYQAFVQIVKTFFFDLERCNISPIVLIHGSFEADCQRLPYLLENLRSDIQETPNSTNVEKAEIVACKVLLGTVFIEVLRKLSVPHAVCPFEADLPIAALARKLNCPVMSTDSDFFTMGLTCVQIPKQRASLDLRRRGSYYMTCETFHPQSLLDCFNIAQEMLPFVATLAGNDKFPRSVFDTFFEKLEGLYQIRFMEREELRRFQILMRWLADQRSLEQALKKVLESVCEDERERVKKYIVTFNTALDEVRLDFLKDTATMSLLVGVAPRPTGPGGFLEPPALRQAMARGSVIRNSVSAVYGLPWRVGPAVEDPCLPCSSRAAVPLLARLSALLGAPLGPLVLFTSHGGELCQLLAGSTWRAPLLEQVLLGGPAECIRTGLAVLQLRPGALAELPPLLRLPAAALVVWRRATLGRSGRRQVRAVLLCLLALTPDKTPASDLGLTPAAAAKWRAWAMPLRNIGMEPAWFDLTAMHLYCELQNILRAVWSLNEMLDRPLEQIDVEHSLHPSLTMLLGFVNSDEGGEVVPGAKVQALVSAVTDAIEAEVDWRQDAVDGNEAGGARMEGGKDLFVPWKPSSRQDTSSEHPDLRAARTLTGILNKMTDATAPSTREKLRDLTVTTEYGLYTLVDTVCRRVTAEPSEATRCAEVCEALTDMQVASDRGDGSMVRFSDLLLTRLFLDVGPACRVPYRLVPPHRDTPSQPLLTHSDILQHLDSVSDPAERWRQFGELTDCWREAERRQLAGLQLLAATVRRGLVPVWAARRCLERLLGGDGVSRQPDEGRMALDGRQPCSWSRLTAVESQALSELLDWCNSGDNAQ